MVRLGIVGGSSLVSFDPTDEFDAIGLRIASTKQHAATNAYGAVDLKILELKGANASHTLIFMQRHGHSNGGTVCDVAVSESQLCRPTRSTRRPRRTRPPPLSLILTS